MRKHLARQSYRGSWEAKRDRGCAVVLEMVNHQKIEEELKGNTLRVYLYLLGVPDGVVGVREVQRALNFSSPTLAVYHLEKLRELGLVVKESARYRLVQEVRVGVLSYFVRVGGALVPRNMLYAVMFTVLFAFFLIQVPARITFTTLFAMLIGALSTAIFWYEAWRAWREKPQI